MGHLLRPHECGLCTHDIAKLSALWLLLDDGWRSTFLPNEPPSEISGYGPEFIAEIKRTNKSSRMKITKLM